MGKAPTVLLVEDNEDNRIVYTTMLEHFGYHVTQAGDGEAAIAKIQGDPPDVVIMDISMPGIDGWTVISRLREDPATRDIPIVAVTAHALAEHRERAEGLGCEGYLTKPCEPRKLLQEIRRIIG
jgi:two-component system cell cycle response regulator DivK